MNGEATEGGLPLRAHIRELVTQYEKDQQPAGQDEARDRTAVVLMKEMGPSAFDDFLATGAMTFHIQAATFPEPNIEDAKVKTVLFQALDEEGTGVEGVRLIVAKEDTAVTFARTTRADGFSEDLHTNLPFLEPARRFAMEGRWDLNATDPTQLARVANLIIFFIYEVPEEVGDE
jgi:hypothetical protein